MPLAYKGGLNIIEELKEKGYNPSKIRKDGIFSGSTLDKFRNGDARINWNNLEMLCKLLNKQPADILVYVEDTDQTKTD